MNWDAIGAVGELVGAIAVVVTLVFLIVQLRLNTRALEDNKNALRVHASYERTRATVDFQHLLIDSPYLSPILTKIENAPDLDTGIASLDADERRRLVASAMSAFTRLEHQMYLHRQGFLDDEYYRYNTVFSVRFRYPLWKALGILDGDLRGEKMTLNPATLNEIMRIVDAGHAT